MSNICDLNRRYYELIELLKKDIPQVVIRALKEDLGGQIDVSNDITSNLLPTNIKAFARIITREVGIFCGKRWVKEIFNQLNQNITIIWHVTDGQKITPGQLLFEIEGSARILLTAERTVLNFIQTLSGISTKVSYYASLLKNSSTKLLDTRKTLPGLRTALKYAVICGGGINHRIGLSDAFLIKENHIIAIGSIKKAIKKAISIFPDNLIEIEVESIDELIQAINAGAHIVMLDNFGLEEIHQAVKFNKGRVILEVSGNINDFFIKNIAKSGVDYVSVGDLTKNICSIDMSMRIKIK
ncbi:nicotinate-nucleotide diphosphorylase [Candidatus Pantoea edessiphila]|uniref:Probable nicotinate-nucleotide pyrophosphorylase [carboxylating] n=1 Tax=Candidatus Pantoea edessiphila TaxID=2044610 RepID=A0A2P5T249_9GAMM|nr:carboxylating nicotinate-nucleotide diphosphorylase [Candidatus Pantoea edessiphila]PPI88657.1 nicotinate-nucleotide diphosphorylase [Candidatus Pantoea edessiphila]